jgi:hypothetical protein
MSDLSETERAQFTAVLQTIRASGAGLEGSRMAGRDLADKLRIVLPGVEEVTIGRVLHKAGIEIAMRVQAGASSGDIAAAFTMAAIDLVAPALGDDQPQGGSTPR